MTCRQSAPWLQTPAADAALDWLESFDSQWLALSNRLHRPRAAWRGQCAGHAVEVSVGAGASTELMLDVPLKWGATELMAQLPVRALEVLGLGKFTADELKGLPGGMLLESALLGLIEPLENLSGQTLNVASGVGIARSQHESVLNGLRWTLNFALAEGDPLTVPLYLSREAASLVADLLEQQVAPMPQTFDALRLWLKVEAGEAPLTVAELRSLLPGDVVMLDDWPAEQVRLVLNDRLQARAELRADAVQLLEKPIAVSLVKEPCMTESAVESGLDSTLDELPLKLVCQVGSVELSLSQLRELGAGSVVPLTPQLHDGVDLMVNGRRIGQGQLVKLGEGLGVRVLSIATS